MQHINFRVVAEAVDFELPCPGLDCPPPVKCMNVYSMLITLPAV